MKLVRIVLITVFCLTPVPGWAATFTVNTNSDAVDASPGNGVCETAAGHGVCTLRAAVQEAGTLAGAHTIVLPAGTYSLTVGAACSYRLAGNPAVFTEPHSALCMAGNISIQGAGSDVTIINGAGVPGGRGMLVGSDATVSISNLTIQNGVSTGGLTVFGGGGINNQGRLTVSNCVLRTNSGIPAGGGIFNAGTLFVDSTTFTANSSTDGGGAGMYNAGGATATVTNSTFSFGASSLYGGGIFSNGTLNLAGSTISNNSAGFNGGGIYNDFGPLTLNNVTISTNTSTNVAGLYNYQFGTVKANNTTIAFNHATNNNGGVSNAGSFTIRNTILGPNKSDAGTADCGAGPAIVSEGHNIIANTTGCSLGAATATDIYNKEPGLAALLSNGGFTQTHALLASSPAIEAGDPAAPGSGGTACSSIDQRGIFRPQNAKCDIGAFERDKNLSLIGISPSHAGNSGLLAAVISGGGIVPGASARLRRSGQADIVGNPVTVQDGNSAMAVSFNLTGKATGAWSLVVANPDNTIVTLTGAFTIEPAASSQVWAEAVGPGIARAGSTVYFTIVYGNRGNLEAQAVPLTLSVPTSEPLTIRFPVADPPAQAGQVPLDWTHGPLFVTPGPQSGQVNVPLLLPAIPPGFTGVLQVTMDVPKAAEGGIFSFSALAGDPLFNPGLDPNAINAAVTGARTYAQANLGVIVPASAVPSLTQYAQNQLQNAVVNGRAALNASLGTSPLVYSLGQFSIDLGHYAASLAAPGLSQPRSIVLSPHDVTGGGERPIPCGSQVLIEGVTCRPDDHKVPDTDDKKPFTPADCRSIGGHHVSLDGNSCVPDKKDCPLIPSPFYTDPNCLKIPIKTPIDPNAKWGPVGPADQHFRKKGAAFNYEVDFENLPTAPVPAQQVVVTDHLDTATLDLATFALGPISFGQWSVTPPPGLKQFSTGLDLRPSVNLLVKIDAGLNTSTGVVTWKFSSLDPATGQATTDPLAGFLPPNVTPPQGDARLLYSITPKSGLAANATICNQATVVFDFNAPINTPTWCNTFDDTAPVSHVQTLPGSETTSTFAVKWSGLDTGSGIRDYTIYVSDNGGAYSAWQSNTTQTQANYPGVSGHTYAFYSIARDLLGNVEAAKTTADTSTTVGAGNCAADVSAQFTIVRSGYRLNNATRRFQQTVTITRTAQGSLAGPFALAIEKLSSNATVFAPAGTTACAAPGSAYITVNPGTAWNFGQAVTLTVEFVDPTNAPITYTPALLAGAAK